MKYNSIGEQLIAKAKELDPNYKPDKFNDMSEALDVILNNAGGSIPVVEGTMGEDGETITIDKAQTSNFILKWSYVDEDVNIPYYIFMNVVEGTYAGSVTLSQDETGITTYINMSLSGMDTEIKVVYTQSIPILPQYANESGYLYLNVDNPLKLSFEPSGLTKIQCTRKDYQDLTKGGTVDTSTLPTDVPFVLEVGMDGEHSGNITYYGKLEFLMCYYSYNPHNGASKKTWIGYANDNSGYYTAYIRDGEDVIFSQYINTNAKIVDIELPTKNRPITTTTSFNAVDLLSSVLTIQNHYDIYLFGSLFNKFRSPVYSDTNGTLYYYVIDFDLDDLSTLGMKYIEIPTSILPLPADASTSTYVLKAVNGTVQWVKES